MFIAEIVNAWIIKQKKQDTLVRCIVHDDQASVTVDAPNNSAAIMY